MTFGQWNNENQIDSHRRMNTMTGILETNRMAVQLTVPFPVRVASPSALLATSGDSSQKISAASAAQKGETSTIYVVDDAEGLTELYVLFLKGAGYVVR